MADPVLHSSPVRAPHVRMHAVARLVAACLFFLLCAVPAGVAWVAHESLRATLLGAAALAGLAMIVTAQRNIVRQRSRNALEQLRTWDEGSVTVPFHWGKWLAPMAPSALMAVGAVALAQNGPSEPLGLILFAIALLFGLGLLLGLRDGASAFREGHLLRLDSQGIHYLRMPTIPWGDLETLDLTRYSNPRSFGGYYILVAVLHPHVASIWPGRHRVRIPLRLAVGEESLLLLQTRRIAEGAGVPIGTGWPDRDALVEVLLRQSGDPGRWRHRLAHPAATAGDGANEGAQHG